MSDFIKTLKTHPVVSTAEGRDEKQFFGQGLSHYPEAFKHSLGGVNYYLSVYNTPNHTQVNWSLRDADSDEYDYSAGAWLLVFLTPEESLALASHINLPITDWLTAALEACHGDVTSRDHIVDRVTFDAMRSAGIEERG